MALTPVEIGIISGIGAALGSATMIALLFRRTFKEIEETQACLSSLKKAVSDLNVLIANKYQRSSFCGARRNECKSDFREMRDEINKKLHETKTEAKSSFDEVFNRLRRLEERTTRLEEKNTGNG